MSAAATPSRLLARLDERIAAAASSVEADCLRAERACYLARQGRLDDARAVVADVQQRYAQRPHIEVSAWISLTEGLISHFSDMGPLAHDKMRRAYALSAAARLGVIQALSAAWVAHSNYVRWDFASMAKHVELALRLSRVDDHSVRSRSSLIVGQAYHFAGRLDLAMPWYSAVREHANAEGDDATISALMHNMAWLRAAHLRHAVLTKSVDAKAAQYARLGAESTSNFDRLIGAVSLNALVPVLRAQIHALEGDAASALRLYRAHVDAARAQGLARLDSYILADQAWCQAQLGHQDLASRDIEECLARLDSSVHDDDRAATHSRLSQTFALLGEDALCREHDELASKLWHQHARTQAGIVDLLSQIAVEQK